MLFQINYDNDKAFRKFFRINCYIFGVMAILVLVFSICVLVIELKRRGIDALRTSLGALCVDWAYVLVLFSWALLRGYFATAVRFTECPSKSRVLITELFIYCMGIFSPLVFSIGLFLVGVEGEPLSIFISFGLFPLAIIFSSSALTDFVLFKTLREEAGELDENSIERKKEHVYRTPLIIMGGYFLLCLIGILYLPIYVNP